MPAFKFIAEVFTRRKFKGLSQKQNEALIDALAAAKAIDGELKDVERKELMEIVQKLDWNAGESMESYIDRSIEQAVKIEPRSDELGEFFDSIGDRLEEDWLREEAYYLAARIVLADEQIVENERRLLQAMVEGLGVDSDRQQLIMRKLYDEVDVDVTTARTAPPREEPRD